MLEKCHIYNDLNVAYQKFFESRKTSMDVVRLYSEIDPCIKINCDFFQACLKNILNANLPPETTN